MNKSILIVLLTLCTGQGFAQRLLTYGDYIKNVREKNIEYLVQKYNIDIAQANALAARVMPDPNLSVGYSTNQNWSMHMGQSADIGLDYTIELGGKRRARIAVAQSEQQVTVALVEDYFRNLQADAALCYLDALRQKQQSEVALSAYRNMEQIARADSLRFRLGEIAEVNAMQTRVETSSMHNEYLLNFTDYKNRLSDLMLFEGSQTPPDSLEGVLAPQVRLYKLDELIALAQDHRADLKAALRSKDLSDNQLRLAKANRVIDLGLNLGGSLNTVATNEIAPAPRHKTISAGLSIPLKFSNTNKGAIHAAQYAVKQSEAVYDAVLAQIHKEVEQCYNTYISAAQRLDLYKTHILSDAAAILERKKFSYLRGETSLLELLDAQRTYNDVFRTYFDVLYDAEAALVELQRNVGIWDMEI